MQRHDEKLFPVCFASKKLSSAERNYSTIEKECLAIVWGIKRFHLYLYSVPFVLQTDHEPLKYMDSAKFTNDSCDGRCFYKVTISRWKPSKDQRMLEWIILVE